MLSVVLSEWLSFLCAYMHVHNYAVILTERSVRLIPGWSNALKKVYDISRKYCSVCLEV